MYRQSMASPSVDGQEIDRVLRLKRKQREAKACIPCRRRKVKCDHSHPCKTCQKRGHPQICAYDSERRSSAEPGILQDDAPSSVGRSVSRLPVSSDSLLLEPALDLSLSYASPTAPASRHNPVPEDPGQGTLSTGDVNALNSSGDRETGPYSDVGAKEYVFSGDNSVASIVRSRAQHSSGASAWDVGPVLGLQNTYTSYPFMDLKGPQDHWIKLLQILPQRKEILKFFHFYRIYVYPFNPILVDIERFESDLCAYLNAHALGELEDPNKLSERWSSRKSVGFISLILAVLAGGAHFSDLENPERFKVCQDFARRSFQALRLANFLFRPSLDIIQTMLILGNTLQNNGQSDASWALIGTTVRLAQTLGFHTERSMAHLSEPIKARARSCWMNIAWQDSLLSLCHDRPPAVSNYASIPDPCLSTSLDLSYTDMMHHLCRLGLIVINEEDRDSRDINRSIDALAKIDDFYGRTQPHLQARKNCKTLHQHLEHLALKMHVCFCVSFISRPAIKSSQICIQGSQHDLLRQRAKASLVDASKAFLDFQALSIVPLRSWSMIHTVLSSTLLLCIWEETRNDPECRDLQQKVIEVFSTTESATKDDSQSTLDNSQWLSERHIRALVTLRNAFNNDASEPSAGISEVQAQNSQGRSDLSSDDVHMARPFQAYNTFPPMYGYGLQNGNFAYTLNPMDTSPLTYLDSIMNVPLFDFSQESEFL